MFCTPPTTASATASAAGPTARNLAVLGDWDLPVYSRPDPPLRRPDPLEAHHGLRMRQAAHRAKEIYPGPVGDLIADHIQWVADTGWALTAGAKTLALVDQIMRAQETP